MALWLVLKDFNGAVPGAPEFIAVAQILDDTLLNVPALQASGCPMLPWTATPEQVAARNAFMARNPASGSPLPSENLLDLLVTTGAFGGSIIDSGNYVPAFTTTGGPVGIVGPWRFIRIDNTVHVIGKLNLGTSLAAVITFSLPVPPAAPFPAGPASVGSVGGVCQAGTTTTGTTDVEPEGVPLSILGTVTLTVPGANANFGIVFSYSIV